MRMTGANGRQINGWIYKPDSVLPSKEDEAAIDLDLHLHGDTSFLPEEFHLAMNGGPPCSSA